MTQGRKESKNRATQKYRQNSSAENEPYPDTATS